MQKGPLLYEGKAKKLYRTNDENILLVEYKNDLTAFNGEKKSEQLGKGELNNEISALIFTKLNELNIATHFVKRVSKTEQLVKSTNIIPIEVVVRNVAAGSLVKRLGLKEGDKLKQTIVEFYYKSDELKDPLINEDHIQLLDLASEDELNEIRRQAHHINDVLTDIFHQCDLQLVDFKLEFGKDSEGKVILSDEISPDTCRLWDIHTNEKLDKDVFRQDLGDILTTYREVLTRLTRANL